MKVIFICGCLEHGRDGVGDYARRLSAELIRQGHKPALLALYDRYVADVRFEMQNDESTLLQTVRIPKAYAQDVRYYEAERFIADFGPDVLSLQFVPYSFQEKGLPFHLLFSLKNIMKRRKYLFHIMFHEMWLDTPIGYFQRVTAVVQKIIISRLVKTLRPEVVHVSMPFNQKRLDKIGVASIVLPLFGNIYKHESAGEPSSKELQVKEGELTLFYFGAAPKGDFLVELTDRLSKFCEKGGNHYTLFVACGNSVNKSSFVELLHNRLDKFGCKIVDCGFLDIATISALMTQCTAGISRSNARLIGKSGGTIAMLEHGLPVWMPKWGGSESLGLDFRKDLLFAELQHAIAAEKKYEYKPILTNVAIDFIKSLNNLQTI